MSRIFLSHSSKDARETTALKRWLVEQDASLAAEIFVDMDPDAGIPTGVRWREALQQASDRCEAVICLLSRNWAESKECRLEYDTAMELHKQMFCARLEESAADALTSQWQRCDLIGTGPTTTINIGEGGAPVAFLTSGLKRLYNGIRGAGISAGSFRWPPANDPNRAPYRGWEPLTEVDAAVFFGRDAEIVRGLDALRGMRIGEMKHVFVVLGPSGAGKSSFLRAGLMPRLRRDDRDFVVCDIVRPERAAVTGKSGLAQSIFATRARFGLQEPPLERIKSTCLERDTATAAELLRECQRATLTRLLLEDETDAVPPTVLLPLDQAEELFSTDAGSQAGLFMQLINDLVGDGVRLIVAASIRTDRYELMQTAPELSGLQVLTFNDLKPMPGNRFQEVITGPAARSSAAGHRLLLDPELVTNLLADCTEGADMLPILALTLARLYGLHGASGQITLEHYRAMGGMHKVVQTEIDSLLSRDPHQRQAQLHLLRGAFIPWLATINPDNDQPMRRVARWNDLPPDSRPIIDAMVAKRLMVKDTRDGEIVVEVALESLLRQWMDLVGWLNDQRGNLVAAEALERAACAWTARNRNSEYLWAGSRLTDAESLAMTPGFRQRLAVTHDFLGASREAENYRLYTEHQRQQAELEKERGYSATLRKRSRILRVIAAITAVVAVAAVVGFVQANTARNQAQTRLREATSVRLVAEAQAMLANTGSGNDFQALQQLLIARTLTGAPDDGTVFTAVVKKLNTVKLIETAAPAYGGTFSPDGSRFVSGSGDKTIRIWDTETGQPVGQPLVGHDDSVLGVAMSPDGTRIATASADTTVRLWDAATGESVGQPGTGHTGQVEAVAFSPDGRRFASGSDDNTVRMWDGETGQPIGQPLTGHTAVVRSVAFSPDGSRIASAGVDSTIRLWDPETGQQVGQPITGHSLGILGITFSPDGRRLASASLDKTVRFWDASTGQQIGEPLVGHQGWVINAAFSPDGHRLATGSFDKTIRLWDVDNGQAIGDPLTGSDGGVAVTFSRDGRRLASASNDRTIRIWDIVAGQPLVGHASPVSGVAFSPDGRRIASASFDNTIRLWNATTGEPIGGPLVGHQSAVSSITFSPDGLVLASAGVDRTVRLWDVGTGQPFGVPIVTEDVITCVAFSPDGEYLVTGGYLSKTAQMWDVSTRQPVGEPLVGHTDSVNSVAFSPDGTRIATAGDKTVRLWDAATRRQIGEPMKGPDDFLNAVAFSPDGHRIISASSDNILRMWDTDTAQLLASTSPEQNALVAVAFSPDGQHATSGSLDGSLRVWEVAGDELRPVGSPLTGHRDVITSVAYSPDGQRVVSGSRDATLRLWPAVASPQDLCAKLTTNISRKQWSEWVSPDFMYRKVCDQLPIADDAA